MKTKVEQSTGGKVDYKTRTDSQKSTIKQHGEKGPKSSDGYYRNIIIFINLDSINIMHAFV